MPGGSVSSIDSSLLSLFLKIDFRDKSSSGKKRFAGILAAYLVSNTAMAFNFFTVFDKQSFIILTLSSCIFLLALLVLNDFDNLILAGSSYAALSALPVPGAAIFKAKFITAQIYLFPFALVSSLPPSVFIYFYDSSFSDSLLLFLVSVSFCLAIAGSLIFLYGFFLLKFRKLASVFMSLTQFLFFAFVFYSSFAGAGSREFRELPGHKLTIIDNPGVRLLPQTFMAKLVDLPEYYPAAFFVAVAVFFLCYKFIAANYAQLSENAAMISSGKKKRKLRLMAPQFLKEFINRIYLRNDLERSSFRLVSDQLASSAFLRLKYIPYFIMPLMFILIGLILNTEGLLYLRSAGSLGSLMSPVVPLLSPSITIILMMSSRMLISNTKIMDDQSADTEWIYKTLPERDPGIILRGVLKFFFLSFFLPVMLLLFIVLLFRGSIEAAVLNLLFIGSGICFIVTLSSLFDKTMPFTIESGKFNSASKLGEIFVSMFVGIILILIQIFAFQSIIFAVVLTAVFIAATILLNRN